MLRQKKPAAIFGVAAPTPRPTPTGLRLALLYLAAPTLGALLLFDLVVWALGLWLFDVCFAVWCVF